MSFSQRLRDVLARTIVTVGSKRTRIFQDPRYFELWESNGFHITRKYFDTPIPDTTKLKDALWSEPSQMAGIDMNEAGQFDLLSQFVSKYKEEYESLPREKTDVPHQYYVNNVWYGSVDGETLYCMVRHFAPKKIIEIGSGNSTYLSAQASLKNRAETGVECELIACEPYPNEVLKAGFPGLTKLRAMEAQDIPLAEFNDLGENDILFIDSSHVLRIGSDVQYEFLEILPRLNRGVVVHVHDIFFPAEYPADWIMGEHSFPNEQYLLQAFMAFNDSFEVLWAGNYMNLKHPAKLEAAFSSYRRDGKSPRSFWIRKTK